MMQFFLFKGDLGVKPGHHQDLNKRILIALAVSSTLLGGILLFLACFWIYRLKRLKNSDIKSQKGSGIYLGCYLRFLGLSHIITHFLFV